MAVIRLHTAPEYTTDKDGSVNVRESFRVTDAPYTTAAFLALTTFGTTHPDLGVPFRRIASNQRDGAGSIVVLEYGNSNGGFVDPVDETFRSASITSRRVTTTFPTMLKVTTEFDDGSGNVATVTAWRFSEDSPREVTRAHPIHTYRTNFTFQFSSVSQSFDVLDDIMEMTGDLHLIGGKLYAFEPRIINQEKPSKWRVEYSWIKDRGIPLVWPNAASLTPQNGWYDLPSQAVPQSPLVENWKKVIPLAVDTAGEYGPANQRWIRLPYHDIQVYPNPVEPPDPAELPICVQSLVNNDNNLNVWATLPGIA